MVLPHARKTLKLTPGKYQSAKICINCPQQRLGGRLIENSCANILIAPIAVDTNIVPEMGFACTAKGLNGKDIALFHALIGLGLDKRDLLVSMNAITQDVMTGDVADCFDWDGFAVQLNFIALHDFLNHLTDMIYPGIDTSLLDGYFSAGS